MSLANEFLEIADKLSLYDEDSSTQTEALLASAEMFAKSWSGSWLGYHSCVYYRNFEIPPQGARFSREWGLMELASNSGSIGDWVEYNFEDVKNLIYQAAHNPDLSPIKCIAKKAREDFDYAKDTALSLIFANLINIAKNDDYLQEIIDNISNCKIPSLQDYHNYYKPKGKQWTRDSSAAQGLIIPPHYAVIAEVLALDSPKKQCVILKSYLIKLSKHLKNIQEATVRKGHPNVNLKKIFIVHGHDKALVSEVARFLEKLQLEPVILHEQPNLGQTIIEKFDNNSDVGFAIVLYTPCDIGGSSSDKEKLLPRARQNVVFEHGYLIAKLGRDKVCALVKGTIEKPSDIDGVIWTPFETNWKLELVRELNAVGYEIDKNLID